MIVHPHHLQSADSRFSLKPIDINVKWLFKRITYSGPMQVLAAAFESKSTQFQLNSSIYVLHPIPPISLSLQISSLFSILSYPLFSRFVSISINHNQTPETIIKKKKINKFFFVFLKSFAKFYSNKRWKKGVSTFLQDSNSTQLMKNQFLTFYTARLHSYLAIPTSFQILILMFMIHGSSVVCHHPSYFYFLPNFILSSFFFELELDALSVTYIGGDS